MVNVDGIAEAVAAENTAKLAAVAGTEPAEVVNEEVPQGEATPEQAPATEQPEPEAELTPEDLAVQEELAWLDSKGYVSEGNLDVPKLVKQTRELEGTLTRFATLNKTAEKLGGPERVQAIVDDYSGFMAALQSRPEIRHKFEQEVLIPLRGGQASPVQSSLPASPPPEAVNAEIAKEVQAGNMLKAVQLALQHSPIAAEMAQIKATTAQAQAQQIQMARKAKLDEDWRGFIGAHPEIMTDKVHDQEMFDKLVAMKYEYDPQGEGRMTFKRAYDLAAAELGRASSGAPKQKPQTTARRPIAAPPIRAERPNSIWDSTIKGLDAMLKAPSLTGKRK